MLTPKQMKALELLLRGDKSDQQIADECNVSRRTISEWKNHNEDFKNAFEAGMRSQIQYVAAKAFRRQQSLLNSKNDMVAHLAAKDILDRSGFKADGKAKTDAVAGASQVVIINDTRKDDTDQ